MPENEIPAAEEAPVTEEVTEEVTEAAPEETTASDGVPVQMTMDAADLLGDESQPAEAADSRASELKAVLEAVVYVMNEPMPAAQIAEALGRDKKEVEEALRQLVEETARPGRGLFIREVGGGFQMATKAEHHEAIRQFVKNLKQPLKLSQAALETLAVIAYKQPITLPEILEIRGVQGGGVLKTLIDRKLVTTAGRKQVIGRPMLYKTTKDFLTQFGLKDVNELPSLKEFEEIRRQSMADDEFTQAAPEPNEPSQAVVEESAVGAEAANEESGSLEPNEPSPAVVEEKALGAEATNEESGSLEPPGEVSGLEEPTSDGAGADQSEEGPNG